MTDWMRIDYQNPATWPDEGEQVEGLRWLGISANIWWLLTGTVVYVNQPGFPIPGMPSVGFSLSRTTVQEIQRDERTDLPPPPLEQADWWRPVEYDDAVS